MFDYILLGFYPLFCMVMYKLLIKTPRETIFKMQRWPTTRGKIIRINDDYTGLSDNYEYEYSVSGRQYQGKNASCLNCNIKFNNKILSKPPAEIAEFKSSHTQVGEEVDVFYNPSQPVEAYLIRLKTLPKQASETYYRLIIIGAIVMVLLVPKTLYELFMQIQPYLMG